MPDAPPRYDAVVLAGGSARRLGGLDKPAQEVGGRSLLDRVLAAVPDAQLRVVVGPERATHVPVTWVRESPPGGGPVAALAAGLAVVRAPRLVLLAADLPFLDRETVALLLAVDADGAVLVDDDGRDQVLVGAWRTAPLRAALDALDGPVAGARLRAVLDRVDVRRVSAVRTPGRPAPWTDCDTGEELARARESACGSTTG